MADPSLGQITRSELFSVLKNDKLVRLFERLLSTVATAPDPTSVQANLDAHIADIADAHQASAIGFTPTGGISGITVQSALQEIDTEKVPVTRTVNTKPLSADVTLSAADVGADASGAAAAAVATHVGLADPHSQYALDTDLAGYVPTTRTVNGKALNANITLNATDVGLGSVTNDAQTKAAIVPNTAPSAGQVLVGNAGGTAYAPISLSGDATLSSAGVLTSTGKRRLANVTLGSAGTTLASGSFAACQFLEIHIYIEGYAGSDTASLQFNGSGGTAYRYRWLTCAAAATTFAAGLVAASTDRIKVAAVNTTASRRVVCHISNDASVTEKLVQFESVFGTGSAGTQATIDLGNGAWISGAATQITSVSLISSSNMTAGTQMTVYGWS